MLRGKGRRTKDSAIGRAKDKKGKEKIGSKKHAKEDHIRSKHQVKERK